MSVQPLRRILTFQSMFAVLLPFGVVLLIGLIWILPQIRKDAGERQVELARAVGMQIESRLETGVAMVRVVAGLPRVAQQEYQQQLDALLVGNDAISSLYLVESDGRVSGVALKKDEQKHRSDLLSLNLSGNPLFRKLLNGKKPLWSETFLSLVNGGLVAAYGVPGDEKTIIGEIDLGHFTKFLKQNSEEEDLLILVVDHNGQVVADNNGLYTAQQLNIGNIPLVRTGIDTDLPTTGRFNFAGHSMTGSIAQIHAVDWHVLVAKTDVSLYRPYRQIALIILAGILFALFCAGLTSVYMARKLAARFDELAGHAQDIAQGSGSDEWPTTSIDEFNQLSANLKLMARRLRESETLYRTLFEQSPDGVVLLNIPELRPLQFNAAAHNLFGYSREEFAAIQFSDFAEMQNRDEMAAMLDSLRRDGMAGFESVHCTKNGESRNMLISMKRFERSGRQMILAILRDVTERKRAAEELLNLERQLLHAQKLESLGVLAGGIAHDFNNILTAIIGNAELALMRINSESPAVDNLHRIEQAAARAADLAKQMLAYSGRGKFVVENIDLNTLLEDMLHMLEVSVSKRAQLRLNLQKPVPAVEVDATQMRQIVMNLVINASEAIGETNGVISISTGFLECDSSYLKEVWLDAELADGLYVYLEIADTGCGMDREVLSKLFDPFFTTKFTGRGLGMAAVLGIVRGHKGSIKVYSEPGKGSSFKILLPASHRSPEFSSHKADSDDWHGSGRVLFVDDEEAVRGMGSEILCRLGFDVVTAGDGREALEIFRATPDIAFVLLDLTMPNMDGEDCFRELRKLKPDVKVIISSGYNEQEVTRKFVGRGLSGFIQKPYKISGLKEVIRGIL